MTEIIVMMKEEHVGVDRQAEEALLEWRNKWVESLCWVCSTAVDSFELRDATIFSNHPYM